MLMIRLLRKRSYDVHMKIDLDRELSDVKLEPISLTLLETDQTRNSSR